MKRHTIGSYFLITDKGIDIAAAVELFDQVLSEIEIIGYLFQIGHTNIGLVKECSILLQFDTPVIFFGSRACAACNDRRRFRADCRPNDSVLNLRQVCMHRLEGEGGSRLRRKRIICFVPHINEWELTLIIIPSIVRFPSDGISATVFQCRVIEVITRYTDATPVTVFHSSVAFFRTAVNLAFVFVAQSRNSAIGLFQYVLIDSGREIQLNGTYSVRPEGGVICRHSTEVELQDITLVLLQLIALRYFGRADIFPVRLGVHPVTVLGAVEPVVVLDYPVLTVRAESEDITYQYIKREGDKIQPPLVR